MLGPIEIHHRAGEICASLVISPFVAQRVRMDVSVAMVAEGRIAMKVTGTNAVCRSYVNCLLGVTLVVALTVSGCSSGSDDEMEIGKGCSADDQCHSGICLKRPTDTHGYCSKTCNSGSECNVKEGDCRQFPTEYYCKFECKTVEFANGMFCVMNEK